jgi:acetylornithine deacetylase/succinyl-diaminopimelate desuccinylase-like protein
MEAAMIPQLDLDAYVRDLCALVRMRTVVGGDADAFARARGWIREYLAGTGVEHLEFDVDGRTSTILRRRGSSRPSVVADAHLEVVPGGDELFEPTRDGDVLRGRGTADMKAALLVLLTVLRDLVRRDDSCDLWLVITEDEEEGSQRGAAVVVDHLARRGCIPPVALVPDGGYDFGYIACEKGSAIVRVASSGAGGHASRPWLATNPILAMLRFVEAVTAAFPNPDGPDDWRASAVPTMISGGQAANQLPTACRAVLDLRYTTAHTTDAIRDRIEDLADAHAVTVHFPKLDAAASYPADTPAARAYLDILRDVTGREPVVQRSAGASNGRFYAAAGAQVLMTSLRAGGAHSHDEWVDVSSAPMYHALVHRTVAMASQLAAHGEG